MGGSDRALATGNPGALLEIGSFAGGTGVVDPGSESRADALVDLEEGTYVMLCFIEGPDGLPSSGVVEVVNASDAHAHEMTLLRLAEGKTAQDVGAFFEGGASVPLPSRVWAACRR